MKKIVLLLLCFAAPGFAQCPGGCPDGTCSFAPGDREGWQVSSLYNESLDLYHRGELVGSLNADGRWLAAGDDRPTNLVAQYFNTPTLIGENQGTNVPRSPIDAHRIPGDNGHGNFGMTWQPSGQERFTINGKPVPKAAAIQSISADPTIPDDRKLPRLTVIAADPAQRRAVVNDLQNSPELAPFKNKVVVQALAPTDWQVQGLGYVASGKPTIYLQSADGKVLHRQDDYADGPAGLAGALRAIDPTYDPAQDKDLRKSSPTPTPDTDETSWGFVGLASLLALAAAAAAKRTIRQ